MEERQIFTIDVNWDEKNPDTNECKVLKLTFSDGKTEYMKKDLLFSLLWALGNPEEQKKMIPLKITKVRWYETVVGIKAKQDIRRGEEIKAAIKIQLPSIEEEALSDMVKAKQRSQFVLPGK